MKDVHRPLFASRTWPLFVLFSIDSNAVRGPRVKVEYHPVGDLAQIHAFTPQRRGPEVTNVLHPVEA